MFEAIGDFFNALINSIANLPVLIRRELLSIDLSLAFREVGLRGLVIAGLIVLVAILTYRSRDTS